MVQTAISLLTASMLLISCAAKSTVVGEQTKTADLSQATLVVAPLMTHPPLSIPEDAATLIQLNLPAPLYSKILEESLPTVLQAETVFGRVVTDRYKAIPASETRLLHLPGDQLMSVSLPIEPVQFDSVQADFILFLENLHAHVEKDRIEDDDPAKTYTVDAGHDERDATFKYLKGYKFYLVQNCFFALVENQSGTLVAHGQATCKTVIKNTTSAQILYDAVADLADELLRDTSFKGVK